MMKLQVCVFPTVLRFIKTGLLSYRLGRIAEVVIWDDMGDGVCWADAISVKLYHRENCIRFPPSFSSWNSCQPIAHFRIRQDGIFKGKMGFTPLDAIFDKLHTGSSYSPFSSGPWLQNIIFHRKWGSQGIASTSWFENKLEVF